MLPQWDLYLEWMVANRPNEVEWILLKADSWADYAVSPERQARLRELTDRCHRHGIACGVVRDSARRGLGAKKTWPWREKDKGHGGLTPGRVWHRGMLSAKTLTSSPFISHPPASFTDHTRPRLRAFTRPGRAVGPQAAALVRAGVERLDARGRD